MHGTVIYGPRDVPDLAKIRELELPFWLAGSFGREGRLADALRAAEDMVRADPAAGRPRVLLSQLLAVTGAWDRCVTQLEVAGRLEAGNLLMAQVCRHLVVCERFRADVFAGRQPENPPRFGEIAETMLRHARLLCEWQSERWGIRDFRKHATWYTKGFPGSTKMRDKLIRIEALAELEAILAEGDGTAEFPPTAMRAKRGKKGGSQKVVLPEGFRNDLQDATPPEAEDESDGG